MFEFLLLSCTNGNMSAATKRFRKEGEVVAAKHSRWHSQLSTCHPRRKEFRVLPQSERMNDVEHLTSSRGGCVLLSTNGRPLERLRVLPKVEVGGNRDRPIYFGDTRPWDAML